jgi:hypothetical protein
MSLAQDCVCRWALILTALSKALVRFVQTQGNLDTPSSTVKEYGPSHICLDTSQHFHTCGETESVLHGYQLMKPKMFCTRYQVTKQSVLDEWSTYETKSVLHELSNYEQRKFLLRYQLMKNKVFAAPDTSYEAPRHAVVSIFLKLLLS